MTNGAAGPAASPAPIMAAAWGTAGQEAQLQRFNAAQAKPLWPSLLEAPVIIDHSLNKPKLPTDDYVYWSN